MDNHTISKREKRGQNMEARHPQTTTVARPVAPATRTGERPNEKPVDFTLDLPQAKSVVVAGSFNQWDLKRTPMQKDKSGAWKTTVWLPPGRYEYRFHADGQWLSDPKAKESVGNSYGSSNSVVSV
jgi:1,4-alpha-glucan branching enzyme